VTIVEEAEVIFVEVAELSFEEVLLLDIMLLVVLRELLSWLESDGGKHCE
jgi:hypothetical protein